MATSAGPLPSERFISKRIFLWIVILFGIFAVTGVLLAFNYWLAIVYFFASLLILVRFGLEKYEERSLYLLLVLSLFVAVLVDSLTLLVVSNDPKCPYIELLFV